MNVAVRNAIQAAQTSQNIIQNLLFQTKTMENTKTQPVKTIPLRYVFVAIAGIIIFGLIFMSTGNAESKYAPKYKASAAQIEKLLRNSWCPMKRNNAADKLEDDNHGVKFDNMNRDQTALYRDMDCSKIKIDILVEFNPPKNLEKVSFIPTAKALSFDNSSFLEKPKELRPIHAGNQAYIDYAWEISHDRNFIYMLKAENGLISPDRRSDKVGLNGYYDYGFCQTNAGHHKQTVKDPRFFTDWKWQMDQCLEKYRGGTTFYGLKRFLNPVTKADKKLRENVLNSFTWA